MTAAPPAQAWDPVLYARDAGFVVDLGGPVIDLLAPRRGERILDLGCGDGALTERLAAFGARVVGIDSSPELAAAARDRGLDVRVGDGRSLGFDGEFDAVFSNAALHWMGDLDPVTAGVRRALRPGGRFAGEFGGEGNVAAVTAALTDALGRRGIDASALNPWTFPSAEAFAGVLRRQGFTIRSLDLFSRPTTLPGDLSDWLAVFAGPFFHGVAADDRATVIDDVRTALAPALQDGQGRWHLDYVRLRFLAVASAAGSGAGAGSR